MLKIVHGIPFIGQSTDRYRVKAIDLGYGHIEASAVRVVEWTEADWSPEYLADVLDAHQRAKEEEDQEERRALMRQRAARRAKTRVRRLCKAMGLDTLLTLTYRGAQPDLALMKRHIKEFNRRMLALKFPDGRAALPGFCFVAGFELQQRGTWHAHLACRDIPSTLPGVDWRSFNVIRAIWRGVTGQLEGNIDVQRRKRNAHKSSAQVAAYISKYISKTFEDEAAGQANRYAVYGARADVVPEAVDLGLVDDVYQAIVVTYGLLMEAQCVSTARLDRFRDWFFMAGEKLDRRRQAAPREV